MDEDEEINEDAVELAKQYAIALADIKELKSTLDFNEDDLELAKQYAIELTNIKELEQGALDNISDIIEKLQDLQK